MRVRVIKSGKPAQNAKVDIKWFSNVGGLQVGSDSGRTDALGYVEFVQPFNLFGAYGEGNASSGLSYGEFNAKLDAYGNAPETVVTVASSPSSVVTDSVRAITDKSWPFLIAIAVLAIAVAFGLTQVRGLLKR